MRSFSEKDIWAEVRAAERQHGDRAEAELARRIHELTAAEQFDEASFWSAVAARLKQLHDIKLPGPSVLPKLLNEIDSGKTS
ncbi:DUF6961 family protein [Sphingopyxis sp. UBA6734]|uniref:DUF6961 family protein n=1 Tax=Sphingopyxis sp. UBA6734 TaxID=1947539 RepID=UPI0039C8E4D9